jgi:alpha-N-arabinofuranosidase
MASMAAQVARVVLDSDYVIGEVSPMLFGGFAEHLGRCIYQGIYEPGHPLADADGLRLDVRAALEELTFTSIRYPGGNFVSGYDWLDGVGPPEQRPRRRELAWRSIESNRFGTNEFLRFCRKLNAEPMLGLNFGTGTIESASAYVEYCNAPAGTKYADLRKQHGFAEPWGVKYWCLGNEMDGPWQIGHLSADEYARKACEAAKLMKWQDPSIKTILCGSSGSTMSTFPEWDRTILETCWDQADYLSLHRYAENRADDTASYLASGIGIEDHVDALAATLRYVKSKLRSSHDVHLSWDEWNVWYRETDGDGRWQEAPPLLEEIYNLEDALVVAQFLSVFLRRCDVLKIACLAQIVNVIAPIRTNRDGLVKQTIFHPFRLFRHLARGLSIRPAVASPPQTTKLYGEVPMLDVSATRDPETGRWSVFMINRGTRYPLPAQVEWRGKSPARIVQIHQLFGNDPKASNTFERPNEIVPRTFEGAPLKDGSYALSLPPMSLTVLVGE